MKPALKIAIAGLVQGLAEAVNFGMRAGLPMEDVIEVISKGAAGSWQMENRHKTMIAGKFDFGFAADCSHPEAVSYRGALMAGRSLENSSRDRLHGRA